MKRVDVLHPGPFVAAQASALWFSLTHCLAAALSDALTILPALLAVYLPLASLCACFWSLCCWPRDDRRGADRAVRWGVEDVRLVLEAMLDASSLDLRIGAGS